jgi:hypothetical protein
VCQFLAWAAADIQPIPGDEHVVTFSQILVDFWSHQAHGLFWTEFSNTAGLIKPTAGPLLVKKWSRRTSENI